jgi:hypothetical protein
MLEVLKMDVTCSSRTPVDFHFTTWHYVPEDRTLQITSLSLNDSRKWNVYTVVNIFLSLDDPYKNGNTKGKRRYSSYDCTHEHASKQ